MNKKSPRRQGFRPTRGSSYQRRSARHKQEVSTTSFPARKESYFEFELLDGLAPIVERELFIRFARQVNIIQSQDPSALTFEFHGNVSHLLAMRTPVAIFQLLHFKVPHPLEVIRHNNLERLIAGIAEIKRHATFSSFRIGAAGSNSPEFKNIKEVIAQRSGLRYDEAEGEMVIRFRRSRIADFGWDVLVRLTPRPLSARAWRTENMPGALNATIAAAMILELEPKEDDIFLNLMCGSGTILVERALLCPFKKLIGVDNNEDAVAKTKIHLAKIEAPAQLLVQDTKALSLADESVDVVCADLPWGRLITTQESLQECYAQTLREAHRVVRNGGTCAMLTQEWRIFEKVLQSQPHCWSLVSSFRVKQADYSPTMYVLLRISAKN